MVIRWRARCPSSPGCCSPPCSAGRRIDRPRPHLLPTDHPQKVGPQPASELRHELVHWSHSLRSSVVGDLVRRAAIVGCSGRDPATSVMRPARRSSPRLARKALVTTLVAAVSDHDVCALAVVCFADREVSSAYCRAAPAHPAHARYHDLEYGFPSSDDCVLFERLMLEINQAGLSWLTILSKRADFRAAFAGFDIDRVAAFGADDVERLLADARIVRTRLKIAAAIRTRGDSGSAPIARLVLLLARCASPASARCLDAIVPQKLPFHRWPDRQRILDEPRLSGGGARARLPGLCADRGTLAALGPPGTGLNVP